jgi:hypothetical protein
MGATPADKGTMGLARSREEATTILARAMATKGRNKTIVLE